MKIHVDTGERAELIVSSRLPSNAAVMITTDAGEHIAQILVEDGLLSEVVEYTIRRHRDRAVEDRLTLWAHLVSEHGSCIGLDMTLAELVNAHEHEHDGPGTIRSHPRESRAAQLPKIILTLSESDHYGVPRMSNSQVRQQLGLLNREIEIRLRATDDTYEGSFCEAADNEGARIAARAREGKED